MSVAFSARILRNCAGTALALCLGFSLQAQTQLDPEELRRAAVVALKGGEPAVALQYGSALVARDAGDLNAHLIMARAARDMGDIRPARSSARTAWQLAETDSEKYSAALITAQVLATDGKRSRAQLWLRRAAQNAPNDALRARAERDFGYVKQQNPWRTDLSFTLAPNSNINNGSARDRSELNYQFSEDFFGGPVEFALDPLAQAISGIEIGGSAKFRYRFHQTPTTAHDAKVALSYRTFRITDELVRFDAVTQQLTEVDVSGSDFAFGSASLGYGYRQINADRRGEFAFDTEAGQSWYGGSRYASFLRVQASQSLIVKGNRRLRFGGDAERQWGQATPDLDTIGASASITQAFANGNSGYVGAFAKATQSVDETIEYNEITLRTGLSLRDPVMGAAVQFGLGYSWRDYDVSRDSREGRQDNRLFADVTATFKEIDYYGFNPTVSLSASTTDSNIGRFDVNRVGLNIGIKSAF